MRRALRRWQARRAVILAAKCVESGWVPSLDHKADPDDLEDLIAAVRALRTTEQRPFP